MSKRVLVSLVLAIALAPAAAYAQSVDGAAGFRQLVTWLIGPLGGAAIAVGAAVLGFQFLGGRRDYEHMFTFALGATIIASAFLIAAFWVQGF